MQIILASLTFPNTEIFVSYSKEKMDPYFNRFKNSQERLIFHSYVDRIYINVKT